MLERIKKRNKFSMEASIKNEMVGASIFVKMERR